MKFRIALGLLLLLAVALPSYAVSSCNQASGTLQSDNKTYAPNNLYVASETQVWAVSCVNSQTGVTTTDGTTSVTAQGSGGLPQSGPYLACNPTFSHAYGMSSTAPTTGQYYFEAIANDGVYGTTGIVNPTGTCSPGTLHTNFQYCPLVACSTGGSGGGGGDPCLTEVCGPLSPIILDLSGNGFFLTSAEAGVSFDITGDGQPIQIAWTAKGADNAFLALPGADGLVHTGKELFGNFTPQPPSANPDGFAALAVYDLRANGGNGKIDPGDAIYSSLRLWIDANHDGICQPEELHTLASLGVTSISLHYTLSRKVDQYGNVFRYKSEIDANQPDPDHVGRTAYDVFFTSLSSPDAKNLIPLVPGNAEKCPAVSTKAGMLLTGN